VRVERLRLVSFRNYHDETVDFAPGLNLVVGANAQGKTNLLEALHFLGGLGSPRGSDVGIVLDGAEAALLHADVVRSDRSVHIDLEFRPGRGARTLINRVPAAGPRALRDLVVAVFFGPDDLALVKGAPDLRRRWLDDLVVKLHPARESLRREWERVLRQRNTLLKSAPRAGSARDSAHGTLAVWDEAFCRLGAQVAAARLESLGALLPYAQKRYEVVAGGGRLDLSYAGAWLPASAAEHGRSEQALNDALAAKLDEVASRELERGVSLVGPQRDDVDIRLAAKDGDGSMKEARTFASQGDQRTIALALKVGEFDLLCDALGDDPILLLDDVFSELDVARRSWLLDSVGTADQTIVSSAESNLPLGEARVVRITAGKIDARG
jgi:DNA replication and repair protein RecF